MKDNKHLTELEYEVLTIFCNIQSIKCPDKLSFEIIERRRDPVGFITDLYKNNASYIVKYRLPVFNMIPNANCLEDKIKLGFLLYFDEGEISSIEGYAVGDRWPTVEWPVRFDVW